MFVIYLADLPCDIAGCSVISDCNKNSLCRCESPIGETFCTLKRPGLKKSLETEIGRRNNTQIPLSSVHSDFITLLCFVCVSLRAIGNHLQYNVTFLAHLSTKCSW